MRLPARRPIDAKTVAILVVALVVVVLGAEQVTRYGPKGEFTRVRSFFYPHYELIPLKTAYGSGSGDCEADQEGAPGTNTTTAYWFTPFVGSTTNAPIASTSVPVAKPMMDVALSQADVNRVGVTPMPVTNAPPPRQLGIIVDGGPLQVVTLANPPAFQTFSLHDGTGGSGGGYVELWLLSSYGNSGGAGCALTGISLYSRN